MSKSEVVKTDHGVDLHVTVADGRAELVAAKTWEELDLKEALLKGLYDQKFSKPFVIQESALPLILRGFHKEPKECFLGQAKSGSGKTMAFALSILQHVDTSKAETQAVIVNPARELAVQNLGVVQALGAVLPELTIAPAIPEAVESRERSRGPRERQAKVNAHVVIGTPGRIKDWLQKKVLSGKTIRMLVLDEADEMDVNHRDNVRIIRSLLTGPCQVRGSRARAGGRGRVGRAQRGGESRARRVGSGGREERPPPRAARSSGLIPARARR